MNLSGRAANAQAPLGATDMVSIAKLLRLQDKIIDALRGGEEGIC